MGGPQKLAGLSSFQSEAVHLSQNWPKNFLKKRKRETFLGGSQFASCAVCGLPRDFSTKPDTGGADTDSCEVMSNQRTRTVGVNPTVNVAAGEAWVFRAGNGFRAQQ